MKAPNSSELVDSVVDHVISASIISIHLSAKENMLRGNEAKEHPLSFWENELCLDVTHSTLTSLSERLSASKTVLGEHYGKEEETLSMQMMEEESYNTIVDKSKGVKRTIKDGTRSSSSERELSKNSALINKEIKIIKKKFKKVKVYPLSSTQQ